MNAITRSAVTFTADHAAGARRSWFTFFLICAGLVAVGVGGGALLIERVKHQLYSQHAESERLQTEAMSRLLERELSAGRTAGEVIAQLQSATREMRADGNFICLFDQNGVLLTHPNPQMVGMSKAATPMRALQGGGANTYGGLIAGLRPTSALIVDARSAPEELVYLHPVPNTPWTLASHENTRKTEAHFRQLGWQLVAIAAPTIGLMALVGTALARATGRRYERRIETANAMLEQRVAERTAELELALGELRAAHERLVQGEKMHLLGELMSGIAHEIANPLAVVAGYGGLLAQGDHGPVVQRYGANIEAGVERARKIVANLLAFARRQPPTRRPESLVALLEQAIELIAADLRRSDVTLQTDLPAECAPLCIDAQQMEQVFLNLLNNARQALQGQPGERVVRVSLRETPAGDVVVTFADTGPGIATAARAQLFRPFVTTKATGTGLGLSLCSRFVEAHGGRIEAPLVARGAKFVISLPRAARSGACAVPRHREVVPAESRMVGSIGWMSVKSGPTSLSPLG